MAFPDIIPRGNLSHPMCNPSVEILQGPPQYKHRKWSQTFGFKHLVSSPYETMISSFFSVNGEGVFLDLDYGSSMVCC